MSNRDRDPWYIPNSWVKESGRPTRYLKAFIDDQHLTVVTQTFSIPDMEADFWHKFSGAETALVWTRPKNSRESVDVFKCDARTGAVTAHARRLAPKVSSRFYLAKSGAMWIEFDTWDQSWCVYRQPAEPAFEGRLDNIHADNPVLSDDGSLIAFFNTEYSISFVDVKSQNVVSQTGPTLFHWHHGVFSPCNRYFITYGTDTINQQLMLIAVQVKTGRLKNRGYRGVDFGNRRPVMSMLSEAGDPLIYLVSDGGHRFYFDTDSEEFSGLYTPRLGEHESPLAWQLKNKVLYFANTKRVTAHSPSGSLLHFAPLPNASARVQWTTPQVNLSTRRQGWKRWGP
jgi:hypothetical protein